MNIIVIDEQSIVCELQKRTMELSNLTAFANSRPLICLKSAPFMNEMVLRSTQLMELISEMISLDMRRQVKSSRAMDKLSHASELFKIALVLR